MDADLNAASSRYDSIILSNILAAENRRSALRQELLDLRKLEVLVTRMNNFQSRVEQLASAEGNVRSQLREARERAERDAVNVSKLKDYFLDCLLRSRLPGIYASDIVDLPFQTLEPQITSATGGLTITSFSTLSSGGKKTLFKCCFAVAVHRLAAEIGAALPSLLIIDSPMKNISERENKDQYEHFHQMLYELAESELEGTQFVLIDKEYLTPPEGFGRAFEARYMTPEDADNPPLISYYRGK